MVGVEILQVTVHIIELPYGIHKLGRMTATLTTGLQLMKATS